jgi:ABC-type sugar transport system ATPase subunit
MKRESLSLVYISHKLDEVFELSDRILVLRDGQSVAEMTTKETTPDKVIAAMVGREVTLQSFQEEHSFTETILSVSHLSHKTPTHKAYFEDISFDLHPGEILGVSGIVGAGRSELLKSILGFLPGEQSGNVQFSGNLKEEIGFVSEDRKKEGLFFKSAHFL